MASSQTLPSNTEQNIIRPLANYPPSLWGFTFASFSFPHSEFESHTKEVELLKEKVNDMLKASKRNLEENIEFINLLCRLGVSYHFESEIEDQLHNIFSALHHLLHNNDYDLYITSLLFRVLRQHGRKMPCDAFNKFKNEDGTFMKSIESDVRGMLSLYEASFLSVHGEDIMDDALSFTRTNLESIAMKSTSPLAKHIKNALDVPFHKGIPRLEARRYISFYQENNESPNEILLKFAKVDFNRLQLLHRQELAIVSRWWKELNAAEIVPFTRDRIIELYLWANASHFEPQYDFSRKVFTKFGAMMSMLDDTYDSYGSPEELEQFTDAFERLDIAATDHLPDYMKALYRFILNVVDEVENIVTREGRSYAANYVKEAFKELVRCYHQEAKWFNSEYVPPFDKYLRNGLGTSGYGVLPVASLTGMKSAEIKEFEWVKSNPQIAKATKKLGRLENDLKSHKDEQKRGDCASGVQCYMKEYGASEEEATKQILKMCANFWKDANEELIKPTAVEMPYIKVYLNLMRVNTAFYRHIDAYSKPWGLKDEIALMFIEKIPV